jgi:hypothetical protein
MVSRITQGRGAGQERTILANTSTTLTLTPPWDIQPDASSFFAVAEAGWHFGALTKGSPVQFAIPNRSGETVQICGRAANINDVECALELSTVTRWQIGGSGLSDSDIPPEPVFLIGPGPRGGTVELSGVSFADLANTRSISAGTLTLHYWDELQGKPTTLLASAIGANDDTLDVTVPHPAAVGSFLQIDSEVLRLEEVQNSGSRYRVVRGVHGSEGAVHEAQSVTYNLLNKTLIAPFPLDFFGSPYSGSWSFPIAFPHARVASAEFFVTNQKGNSTPASLFLTNTVDHGLRTLSGGQYSIQVDGYLAVDESIAPALVVESAHSVRDVFAVLGKPADAEVQLRVNVNGIEYCVLTFAVSGTVCDSVSGVDLPPLAAGARVTVSVLSVGQTYPGGDLTVLIRL